MTSSGLKFSSGAPGYMPIPRVYPAVPVAASIAAAKAFSRAAEEAVDGPTADAEATGPEIAAPAPAMIEFFRKSRLDVDMHLP